MDDASFAAFMTAILHWEGRLPGNAKPPEERDRDRLGDIAAITIGYDASTGIANIRPSVALEILEGRIRGLDMCFYYEVKGVTLKDVKTLQAGLGGYRTGSQPYDPLKVLFYLLQDPRTSIEFLAANTQRGADRITTLGYKASVFNLAAWANAGVQTPNEFLAPGVGPKGQSYGNVILGSMAEAFEVLFGSGFIGRYLPYNMDEARFIDPDKREPTTCPIKGPC
jgi:hypothetical protein